MMSAMVHILSPPGPQVKYPLHNQRADRGVRVIYTSPGRGYIGSPLDKYALLGGAVALSDPIRWAEPLAWS